MFYNGKFVGNWEDAIYGDYTQAKTLGEIESLIQSITNKLTLFDKSAPEILRKTYQARLEEIMSYYRKFQ